MQKFQDTIFAWINQAQPVILAVVAIALLLTGIMMIWPSERTKEKAKEAIPWIVIGSAVALGAVAIAKSITDAMTF